MLKKLSTAPRDILKEKKNEKKRESHPSGWAWRAKQGGTE
jgi:hypothetical protein